MFTTLVNIKNLVDDQKCYDAVRSLRWADKCLCPHCDSTDIIKRGKDEITPAKQRYICKSCEKHFDDLTGTLFSGHHQPLKVWVLCLYFMGLNLSNLQISKELDLNKDDVQKMTSQLRDGIYIRAPEVKLSGEVEFDEVYVVAGHKGNSKVIKKRTSW